MKKKTKVTPPVAAIAPKKKLKKVKKIKKKIIIPQITVETVIDTPLIKKNLNSSNRPDEVTFYGHSIRHTFMNNQWYFSLEDLLKVVDVIDPTKFLIDLKNHESLKDKYYQLIETFSYYEGDSPIIIPVINYQNFLEIFPSLREMNLFFPGPFPDWLKDAANRKF